jgi:hypothetical protein
MSFIPRINKVHSDVTFTNEEIRRYGRHLIMPEVTLEGQQKLKAARVIVIGTGGLGAPILAYLAAAGVGTRSIFRTCTGRSFTRPAMWEKPRRFPQ